MHAQGSSCLSSQGMRDRRHELHMRHTLKTVGMYMNPRNAGMTVNANVVTYKH